MAGALAAAGRACLAGPFGSCLLQVGGVGSLGLLLLLVLLLAGLSQSYGAASVAHYRPRPYPGPVYAPPQYASSLGSAYTPAALHGYQLAVFGPAAWREPPPPGPAAPPPPAGRQPGPPRPSASPLPLPPPPPAPTNDTYGVYLQAGGGLSYASGGGALPSLQLDYGPPVTGFLQAAASSGGALYQHGAGRANFSLPILPSDIPVKGVDLPDDGCARDEVRLAPTHRSYGYDQPCQRILERGCCPPGHWVVVNKYTRMGECAPQLCPDGFAFIEQDGLCHDVRESSLCPGGRRVYLTSFGEPACGCGDGQYLDTGGVCRPVYSSDVCPYGAQLLFNALFRLQCAPALCPRDSPVPFQGWCKNFGDPCGDYHFLLGLDTTRLEPACFPNDELQAASGRGRPAPRQVTSAVPPPPPPTTVAVPHLQDSYLPPPGQLAQYARRSGRLPAPAGRSTLAQWLGLSPRRRPGPRRRRPRPRPPQTPLLTPWSRLDIDQVTFVDSERVSSDQLPPRRRRRRRFRRQIFSKVPLLNTCQPGARSGANFKCRDKVLPESSGAQPRSPVPPGNAPSCAPGQKLDALGRCKSAAGNALG